VSASLFCEELMEVRFNKSKKQLKINVTDVSLQTPFQPHLMVDILNAIYDVTQAENNLKFEYFKDKQNKGLWGFRTIPK
jgi:hypothetical protein